MSPNEYQVAASRTSMSNLEYAEKMLSKIKYLPRLARTITAVLKLNSESGELADNIVKHTAYGQELDTPNIIEECGDLLWYIADILSANRSTMEEAMVANIEKLKIRYPEKFTEHDALERKDKCECCGMSKDADGFCDCDKGLCTCR